MVCDEEDSVTTCWEEDSATMSLDDEELMELMTDEDDFCDSESEENIGFAPEIEDEDSVASTISLGEVGGRVSLPPAFAEVSLSNPFAGFCISVGG